MSTHPIIGRYSKEKVKAALVNVSSPSIEARHRDLRGYANRTVERADQERRAEQAIKRHSHRLGVGRGR